MKYNDYNINPITNIKWAPLIPLIGGMSIGAERAFGKVPEAILSYSDFTGNDSQYVNYMQETRKLDIDYLHLDNEDHQEKIKALGDINVLVGTPPCAALSALNTGKSDEVKGGTCKKNEYMYWVFRDGIEKFNADAIVIENAPALYSKKGKVVAKKMEDLANKYGYSFTLYKTNTALHGVPQNRLRTFALMWKSEASPVMEWYKKESKNFSEYLMDIPKDAIHQTDEDIINKKLLDEPWYKFVEHKTDNVREALKEDGCITCVKWILKHNLINEAIEWYDKTGNERGTKLAVHAKGKFAQGLGIWDSSLHSFSDKINAVIGRNMQDSIHPFKERSLNIRECLHLMAFPHDFELVGGVKNSNMIAQNVPACTAESICTSIKLFLTGDLEPSNGKVLFQDNINSRVDRGQIGPDLTHFF